MDERSSMRWFRDIGLADRPQAGGKGASLGELTRAGIQVPPGFVVPVAAFEEFLESVDADGACRAAIAALNADDLDSIASLAADFRDRIASAEVPRGIVSGIASAYLTICRGQPDRPVAVRSSATAEDSDEASFAGLQDTYLWIRGEASVIEQVRRCWASLYNMESVAYRLRLKLPEDHVAMAVVVQCMVLSRCAGVIFTRSPTTGDRSTIIVEGTWGFGSALVSGEVTPDRFVLNKVTGEIVSRKISSKLIRHVPDAAACGVATEPVPPELQSVACLSDAELAVLADTAKRIERHYGQPQDIEWAIADADGGSELFVLQSRPETVWSARDREPVATARISPFDHVLAALSRRGGRQ
jgi:pyruvate,water dikinase